MSKMYDNPELPIESVLPEFVKDSLLVYLDYLKKEQVSKLQKLKDDRTIIYDWLNEYSSLVNVYSKDVQDFLKDATQDVLSSKMSNISYYSQLFYNIEEFINSHMFESDCDK